MNLTIEQQAIVAFVKTGKGNLVVEALAGSGKTSTILASLPYIPQRSILLSAFNKRIASELQEKLPKMPRTHAVHVKTFHALGLGVIRKHYPSISVSRDSTEAIVNQAAGASINYRVRRACVRLLQICKEIYTTLESPDSTSLGLLGWDHNIFEKMEASVIDLTIGVVQDAYILSSKLKDRETIDFTDMTWAPVVLGLAPPSRYQAIFVDELQDINRPQLALLLNVMALNGRFIGIGDRRQEIYQFRASIGADAWDVALTRLSAKFLPLTESFRCSKAVTKLAQQIVPELRCSSDANEGSISNTTIGRLSSWLNMACDSTFVLSRDNASLLDCALHLWRDHVRFQLNAGRELLEPIFYLLDNTLDLRDKLLFTKSLDKWRAQEIARATRANSPSMGDRAEEQYYMLRAALSHAEPFGIKGLLAAILMPNDSGVLLSTVHKVKGLEADRVFLLKQTFARHSPGSLDGSQFLTDEDINIEYVAITRARGHVVWVDIQDRELIDTEPLDGLTTTRLDELLWATEREAMRLYNVDVKRSEALTKRFVEIQAMLNAKVA